MSTSCRLVLFSFNNSETVKAVTLVFSNFFRDIPAKLSIPNSPHSPDIGQNADAYFGYLDFWSILYKRKLS